MSEQSKILEDMQKIIMNILTSGSASQEESSRIDELEILLYKQKCYKEIEHSKYTYQGEEIAGFFLENKNAQAIDKMNEYKITPEDFFGFIEYHDEEEEFTEIYTNSFKEEVNKLYNFNCKL